MFEAPFFYTGLFTRTVSVSVIADLHWRTRTQIGLGLPIPNLMATLHYA